MLDIALVVFFCSMILVPCIIASRNIHRKKEASSAETGVSGTIHLMPLKPSLTRAEILAKRQRDLYFRRVS